MVFGALPFLAIVLAIARDWPLFEAAGVGFEAGLLAVIALVLAALILWAGCPT